MTNNETLLYFVLVILVIVVIILGIQVSQYYLLVSVPTIPACMEDELVLGWGDYKQGYYEQYLCRAIDDIAVNGT